MAQKKNWLLRTREKQKSRLNTSSLSENMSFLLQNLFVPIVMLISRKPVQRRGIGENLVKGLT